MTKQKKEKEKEEEEEKKKKKKKDETKPVSKKVGQLFLLPMSSSKSFVVKEEKEKEAGEE